MKDVQTPIIYKDLLILKLSDVAEWLNEKEMIVPKDVINLDFYYKKYHYFTCEFLGKCCYILRGYWKNRNKQLEERYLNDQPHGKFISWTSDGFKYQEIEWKNGLEHGSHIEWHKNGNKFWERQYRNGKIYGKLVVWNEAGQIIGEYD